MKILIIGATSKTAEAIARNIYSTTNFELALMTREKVFSRDILRIKPIICDYMNPEALKAAVNLIQPQCIVNCVCAENVDECEKDHSKAIALNVTLVENLVSICRIKNIHLISFSSDYVFDGEKGPYSEDARPNPISFYGKTKHIAENTIRTGMMKGTIIRTNVIFGVSSFGKKNFIDFLIDKFEEGKPFGIVGSQFCNPVLTNEIALAVKSAIINSLYGVFHVGGSTYLSRYEIAKHVERIFGYAPEDIENSIINMIPSSELKQVAPRPLRGGLKTEISCDSLGVVFSDFDSALQNYKLQVNMKQKFYENYLI